MRERSTTAEVSVGGLLTAVEGHGLVSGSSHYLLLANIKWKHFIHVGTLN